MLSSEKDEHAAELTPFQFNDVEHAKDIYAKLRNCLSCTTPKQIEQALHSFFSTPLFNNWEGKQVFLSKYEDIFTKKKFKYSALTGNY